MIHELILSGLTYVSQKERREGKIYKGKMTKHFPKLMKTMRILVQKKTPSNSNVTKDKQIRANTYNGKVKYQENDSKIILGYKGF